jgi:hypothetical protein
MAFMLIDGHELIPCVTHLLVFFYFRGEKNGVKCSVLLFY